jgi:hypothetical protein
MRPDAVSGQMEVEDPGYHSKRFYSIEGNMLAVPGGKIPPIARFLRFIRNNRVEKRRLSEKAPGPRSISLMAEAYDSEANTGLRSA